MNAMLPSFVSTLGWALIHFVWQGALVGMAAAIALMLLRNARPQTRYAVSCIALAFCLALPILGVWRGMHVDASVIDAPTTAVLATSAADAVALSHQTSVALSTSWRSTLQGQLPWIVALWSIGAGLLAARMALGMMWVGRIGRSRSGATHPRWQARLDRLAEIFGIARDVRLRVADDLDSPVAAGWWRPIVLVPAALVANMPFDLLEALLAHELAHIKRHDYLVNLIQSAIEALLFYHPVVWWLSKQIRIEREQIADDLAAQALGDPRRLALALQQLDQYQLDIATRPVSELAPAANGGLLMSRIQRLIRPNQHALSWKMALPIIGLTALCLSVYAHDNTPAVASASATNTAATTAESTAAATVNASATNTSATIATTTAIMSAEAAATAAPVIATSATSTHAASKIRTSDPHAHHDSYAIVRADETGINMSGDTRDIPAIEQTKQKVHGDFVWVRHGGKTYVVQDPAVIARITEVWKPAEALGKQMDALGKQMEVPSKQMEALGKQMEALGENRPYDDAMEKDSTRMQALGRQQEILAAKMETIGSKMERAKSAERIAHQRAMEAVQAQMKPLDEEMRKLGEVMEERAKQMEHSKQPMEELSKQMEDASLPMKKLGKQMDALGKQEEQLSREADRQARDLIDRALQDGKADPADDTTKK
jgi:beta-lactamase regulating signal transducer with metallopeptidase domain